MLNLYIQNYEEQLMETNTAIIIRSGIAIVRNGIF